MTDLRRTCGEARLGISQKILIVTATLGIALAPLAVGRMRAPAEPAFSMSISRVPSEAARSSRCSGCTGPGDRISISLRGAGLRGSRIAVFRDEALEAACVRCATLVFVPQTDARYQVVGVDATGGLGCPAQDDNLDTFAASFYACGARVEVRSDLEDLDLDRVPDRSSDRPPVLRR